MIVMHIHNKHLQYYTLYVNGGLKRSASAQFKQHLFSQVVQFHLLNHVVTHTQNIQFGETMLS